MGCSASAAWRQQSEAQLAYVTSAVPELIQSVRGINAYDEDLAQRDDDLATRIDETAAEVDKLAAATASAMYGIFGETKRAQKALRGVQSEMAHLIGVSQKLGAQIKAQRREVSDAQEGQRETQRQQLTLEARHAALEAQFGEAVEAFRSIVGDARADAQRWREEARHDRTYASEVARQAQQATNIAASAMGLSSEELAELRLEAKAATGKELEVERVVEELARRYGFVSEANRLAEKKYRDLLSGKFAGEMWQQKKKPLYAMQLLKAEGRVRAAEGMRDAMGEQSRAAQAAEAGALARTAEAEAQAQGVKSAAHKIRSLGDSAIRSLGDGVEGGEEEQGGGDPADVAVEDEAAAADAFLSYSGSGSLMGFVQVEQAAPAPTRPTQQPQGPRPPRPHTVAPSVPSDSTRSSEYSESEAGSEATVGERRRSDLRFDSDGGDESAGSSSRSREGSPELVALHREKQSPEGEKETVSALRVLSKATKALRLFGRKTTRVGPL